MSYLNAWQRAGLTAAIVLPITAFAQSKIDDPMDPGATSSVAPYQSVFSDYQPYQEVELIPWRQSNDDVGQASEGGHNIGSMSSEMPPAENTKAASPPAHDMSKMGNPIFR